MVSSGRNNDVPPALQHGAEMAYQQMRDVEDEMQAAPLPPFASLSREVQERWHAIYVAVVHHFVSGVLHKSLRDDDAIQSAAAAMQVARDDAKREGKTPQEGAHLAFRTAIASFVLNTTLQVLGVDIMDLDRQMEEAKKDA